MRRLSPLFRAFPLRAPRAPRFRRRSSAPLIFAMNAYRWEEAGAILAGLIVLVLIVEWISTKIRVKLARG